MDSKTVTPAVEEARTRRAGLHGLLVELESAIAAAAPGREEAWADEVRAKLNLLAEAFAGHVRATEGPDGLFDQVRRRAPRLDHQTRQLATDHGTIAAELAAATTAVGQSVAESRETVLSLLAHLARHRQVGADLVYEAYAVDIGGSD
jgi:hypothetical protein